MLYYRYESVFGTFFITFFFFLRIPFMFSQQTTIRFEKLGHVDGLGIYSEVAYVNMLLRS